MLALFGPRDNRSMFADRWPSFDWSERLCRSALASSGASRASGTCKLLSIDHVPLMEPSLFDTETKFVRGAAALGAMGGAGSYGGGGASIFVLASLVPAPCA